MYLNADVSVIANLSTRVLAYARMSTPESECASECECEYTFECERQCGSERERDPALLFKKQSRKGHPSFDR